jgi:hypothetical protein
MSEKSLTTSAIEFLNNLFTNKSEKNSILDPLTCMARLAILQFKEPGIKISVGNNRISYNNPDYLQGATRWTLGDNREDLHNIYNPIKKTLLWYNIQSKEIKGVCDFAVAGLKKLRETYTVNSTINHTLNLYILEIEVAMKDFPVSKERVDYLNRDEIDSNNTLHKTFTELWSRQEIYIVFNLLKEIDDAFKEENTLKVNALIQSLDKILELKENNVHTFLTETSTVLD